MEDTNIELMNLGMLAPIALWTFAGKAAFADCNRASSVVGCSMCGRSNLAGIQAVDPAAEKLTND